MIADPFWTSRTGGRARWPMAAALCVSASHCPAQLLRDEPPEAIRDITVTEKLGETIPTRLTFTNSRGEIVPLTDFFDGERPCVLALVYFGCPVVCPLVMDRLAESFSDLDYVIGEDFNAVFLSIDHSEGPTEANDRKMTCLSGYDKADSETVGSGWGFLTGDPESIRQLADACGWDYKRLPNGEYSHPVALMIASPDGVVTRYIYGFDYPPKQLKLSLLDASEGKIAKSLGDHLQFFCYRYDPDAGAYTMEAMAVMRIAGVLTVVGLAGLVGGLLVVEKLRKAA